MGDGVPTIAVHRDLTGLLEALAAPDGEPPGSWARPLGPGERIGHFEILREIGRGGFGAVYEALDLDLERRVALKTLRPGRALAGLASDEVRREAKAAARLAHPGIVTLLEACTCGEGPFLVMELLRGEPLEQRFRRGPLPLREAVEVALQVARALAYVHAQGVVHRDLTPGNIFLGDDGRVRLVDLGIAHLLGHEISVAAGTPAYVAPEQWRGDAVDGRADVFSLGVVLFEALSGRRPFRVEDGRPAALDASRPPALDAKVPSRLASLVARCLARDPVRRPSAAQVAEDLLHIQRQIDAPSFARRILLLAAVAVLLGVTTLIVWRWGPRARTRGTDDRTLIAVADFENGTGEREMDALSGLLITSLEQSRMLSVLTRSRVLDLAAQAGHHSETRIDERLAREVGRRAGARALILGGIHRFGAAYAVDVRAVAPEKDAYLFALTEHASRKEDLPGVIDRVGEQVRRALREDETAIRQDRVEVGKAVTRNLDAYEHYIRGVQLWDDCDDAEAVRALEQALALDPDLALAHVLLAFMAEWGNAGGMLSAPHLAAASRSAAKLPDKERRLVEAVVAKYAGRTSDAIGAFRKLAAEFPQDKMVALFAAEAIAPVAKPESDALLERALVLDPSFAWALWLMLEDHLENGQIGTVLPLARRAVEIRPRAGNWGVLSIVQGLSGDPAGAIEAARSSKAASARTNPWGAQTMALALAAAGRVDEALAEIEPWTRRDVPEAARFMSLAYRYTVELRGGRRRAALRTLGEAFAIRDERSKGPGWVAAHAMGGHDEAARAALSSWSNPPASAAALYEEYGLGDRAAALAAKLVEGDGAKLYRARVARRSGAREEAVKLAGEVAAAKPEWAEARYLYAVALAEDGRCREAIPQFDHISTMYPLRHSVVLRAPLALLEAAKCLEKLRQPAEARDRVDRLLALWSRADSDLPVLADANALRSRLTH